MTLKETLNKIHVRYKISPLDAEILLSLVIRKPRAYILAHPEKKLGKLQHKKFASFSQRRSAGEPIAYIAGKKEFFGLDFMVDENVLIPRPETELLIEHALEKILNTRYQIPDTIVDVGTGSGNIIISIAKNIPEALKNKINFYAIDISNEALEIAKANAKKHKVENKIKFIQSDLLECFLKNKIKMKNILVVANLPYVSPALYKNNRNNLKFEPMSALYSRKKGLAHYEKLFRQASALLTDHCSLLIEFSPEQKSKIAQIARKYFPKTRTKFLKDLAGKWRMAEV